MFWKYYIGGRVNYNTIFSNDILGMIILWDLYNSVVYDREKNFQ